MITSTTITFKTKAMIPFSIHSLPFQLKNLFHIIVVRDAGNVVTSSLHCQIARYGYIITLQVKVIGLSHSADQHISPIINPYHLQKFKAKFSRGHKPFFYYYYDFFS